MKIRVVLVDDHTIVLEGLKALLSAQPDIEVVETCVDGDEAVEAYVRVRPDVLVLDQSMPGCTGVEALARLNAQRVTARSVLLTATLSDRVLMESIREGVGGIVLKESGGPQLIQAIREVHAGRQCFPADVMTRAVRLIQGMASDSNPLRALTEREMEVVRELARGHSNKRIASLLGISEGTVKLHLHAIFRKIGVTNRVQLSLLAKERLSP